MLLAHSHPAYRPALRAALHCPSQLAMTVAVAAALTGNLALAAPTTPLDPSGYWSTKDDESIIRISSCALQPGAASTAAATPAPTAPASGTAASTPPYCGTIVWLKEPLEKGAPKTDTENPDKSKRGRPILGMEVFSDFVAEKDHWKGKAYNSDDGKTWDVTFKLVPDKAKGDTIEITGCLVWPLCKSEIFTKAQSVPGGDPTLTGASSAGSHGAAPAKTPAPSSTHTH